MTRRSYYGRDITVTFDGSRCLHAAKCVRGLPAVFDTARKPWILPDAGGAPEIAAIVQLCPTGALEYGPGQERAGAEPEVAPTPTQITVTADGPIWIHGDEVITGDTGTEAIARAALCRCGQTANAPYCDATGPCTRWRHPAPQAA
jgi:uncharacterized Fe-S cluster protein YjdI